MTRDPASVPVTRTIDRFVDDVLSSGRHAAYPVRDEMERVVGLVELKSVRSSPRAGWSTTPVGAVMQPLSETPVAAPGDTVDVLARAMDERSATRALVMDGDVLVGIVSPSDIARLTLALELADDTEPGHRGP